MSADSFHRKVEKEMKDMKEVCDWADFMKCVERSGHIYEMKIEDFALYGSGLSQNQEPKRTRPLLENVSVSEFRKGSTCSYFKASHAEKEFKTTEFLKKKTQVSIENGGLIIPVRAVERGINKDKKEHIIKKLGPLMKPSRVRFFESMKSVDNVADLMDTR